MRPSSSIIVSVLILVSFGLDTHTLRTACVDRASALNVLSATSRQYPFNAFAPLQALSLRRAIAF
jgi:hypothetical protein